MRAVLALTTLPDRRSADRFAEGIVKARLAACVTSIPAHSRYRWKGKRTSSNEVLLLIKTSSKRLSALKKYFVANHPYELPEFLTFAASGGSPAYLAWMEENLK